MSESDNVHNDNSELSRKFIGTRELQFGPRLLLYSLLFRETSDDKMGKKLTVDLYQLKIRYRTVR